MAVASTGTLSHHTIHLAQQYKTAYDKFLGNTTANTKVANVISTCILFAVFVVSCIGSAHAISTSAMGWTVIGLGLSYLIVKLCVGDLKTRKIDVIFSSIIAAVMILFGMLGAGAVLTTASVGCALFGLIGMTAIGSIGLMIYAKRLECKQRV